MKEFFKSWAFKALAVIAALLVGVMIYSATTGGFSTIPETVTGVIITPIQSFFTGIGNAVGDFFGGLGSDRDELDKLKAENEQLRQQLIDYYELKQQNEWYAKMFGIYEEHNDYTFAHGKVVARDPSEYYGEFTIDVGTSGGVTVGDPVITSAGLVGVVKEVGLTYSRVRTVLDPDTRAAASIARTGDTGYTSGDALLAVDGKMRLNYLERTSGVIMDDYVVTSGLGGVFPKGLPIGKVLSIYMATDGTTMYAEVQPFVDISSVTEVMVITSFDGQGEVATP